MPDKTVILGAGAAGIGTAYALRKKGTDPVVYEQDADWGGLCGNFTIDGFRFDRFVHFTFANDPETAKLFEESSPLYGHPSVSYNYWRGYWLKHPVQNNLAPLPIDEKVKIIESFVNRAHKEEDDIKDYGEWLRVQYGDYFAENFPFLYTRKYWGREAEKLATGWIGKRMQSLPLSEILRGAFAEPEENFYYLKRMNYPKQGGFRSIFDIARQGVDIRFNKKATRIDTTAKTVFFADGTAEKYEKLVSTIPLPLMAEIVDNCPADVKAAADDLHWTCGYQVSFGFNRPDIAKHLWFYIYDHDMPPARVYSPNLKAADNVPAGCSALQAEVFFDNQAKIPDADDILRKTETCLKKICGFTDTDIAVKDIRFEPYANVVFTLGIYKNRAIVRDWLEQAGIITVGRFGKWDYLWSHQAFETGREAA